MADLALELGDLGLILRDAGGVGHFIVELTRLVLLDPRPDQMPKAVLTRQSAQLRVPPEKVEHHLSFEFEVKLWCLAMAYPPIRPAARSNPSPFNCPVFGVTPKWAIPHCQKAQMTNGPDELSRPGRFSCAPSMTRDLEVKVLCASRPRRALAKRKGVIAR